MIAIEGIVEHGDQRGRLLGFPTAFPNIQSLAEQLHQDVHQAREWAAAQYPTLVLPMSYA